LSVSFDSINLLGIDKWSKSILLLFDFVYAYDLYDYLKDEKILSNKRVSIYKKVIDLLEYVKSLDIVFGNLYYDSVLVDNEENVYLLNLEYCGILNKSENFLYFPYFKDKEKTFILPPEVSTMNFHKNSDTWLINFLIFFILTEYSPLDFLDKLDDFEHIVSNVSYELAWPPKISKLFLKNTLKYQNFSKFFNDYFHKQKYSSILYQTYITGYYYPDKRPSLKEIRKALDEELNINYQKPEYNEDLDKQGLDNKIPYNQIYQDETEKTKNLGIEKSSDSFDLNSYTEKLPISFRGYVDKIFNMLKNENLYNQKMDIYLKNIISMNYTDFIISLFIDTKDIYLIALFIIFINDESWELFTERLEKISIVSKINANKFIKTKIVNEIYNFKKHIKNKKANFDIFDDSKKIFSHLLKFLDQELIYYQYSNVRKVHNFLTFFFSLLSLSLPFILFFYFKFSIINIALFYLIFFVFSLFFSFLLTKLFVKPIKIYRY